MSVLIERGLQIAGFDAVELRTWLRVLRVGHSARAFADRVGTATVEVEDVLEYLRVAGLAGDVGIPDAGANTLADDPADVAIWVATVAWIGRSTGMKFGMWMCSQGARAPERGSI